MKGRGNLVRKSLISLKHCTAITYRTGIASRYIAFVCNRCKNSFVHSIHQNRFSLLRPSWSMSRSPRKFVLERHEVGVYHCINRCVRRSMLCGWDPFTQRSIEHRKVWLQQRLIFLASVMAIDIEGFCSMGNHLYLIVRNRPDVAAKWSAEEIARKWLPLCPPCRPGTRQVAETPSQADLDAILNNPGRVEQRRLRLSNPS